MGAGHYLTDIQDLKKTRLAMPKTILRAGLIVIEAGLCTTSGLLKREDTRLKTSARVRMGLSFVWKRSLAIPILCFPLTDSM